MKYSGIKFCDSLIWLYIEKSFYVDMYIYVIIDLNKWKYIRMVIYELFLKIYNIKLWNMKIYEIVM